MLHRPAQLLCILSGLYRSMPLFFHSALKQNRHILAHLLSGYTYPHVLYVLRYSVVKLPLKNDKQRSAASYIFELLRFVGSERMVVRLIAILLPPIPLVFIVNSKQVKFLPVYRNFSRIFSPEWAETPVLALDSLPVQAKTRLHSISGIASTACGRPQAFFYKFSMNGNL